MYDVDLYTNQGTIIHNLCTTLEEVFNFISDSITDVQLINITKS